MDKQEAARNIRSATPESVLDALKAQGITSLDQLVRSSLSSVQTQARAQAGGGEQSARMAFIHRGFVTYHED